MKAIARAYTYWLLLLVVVFGACLMSWHSIGVGGSLISAEQSYTAIMIAEVVFVLFFWPFVGSPGWREEEPCVRGVFRAIAGTLAEIMLLPILAAPIVASAAYLSAISSRVVFETHLFVLTIATLVATWGLAMCQRRLGAETYVAFALFVCGMLPLGHYLAREMVGVSLVYLKGVSPVWSVVDLARERCGNGTVSGMAIGSLLSVCLLSAVVLFSRTRLSVARR